MKPVLKVLAISFLSSAALAVGATQVAQNAPKNGGGNDLMKCMFTPKDDEQSSSLPTTQLGFKFSLERNNSNHIAVDTYTLNERAQQIKQVGHAELIGAVTTVTATTKAADILASLSLAEDSPFEFTISFSAAPTSDGRFDAVIDDVVTFQGQRYSALTVQCRIAPEAANGSQQQQQAPAAQQ